MIEIRPYQREAVRAVRDLVRAGRRRILLVAPTGSGKTVIAAYIIAATEAGGRSATFVAHRRELIRQSYCKLVRAGIAGERVGVIMAGVHAARSAPARESFSDDELWAHCARRRPTAPVQVASIDTLRNCKYAPPRLLMVDEAHRSLSPSYVNLITASGDAVVIGLTATPYRADNKPLGGIWDELVVVSTPRQLIAERYLVEPRVFTVPAADLPDLSNVRIKGGDYDSESLSLAVDQSGLVGNIVEHWQKRAEGRRTVVFAASVEHSKHIRDRFAEAGIAAEHIDGTTPTPDRDAILIRLACGATTVVCNYGVLCEGWDMPAVKCCVIARPTKSTGLYLQQAGRILRPWQDVGALILDHAGCVLEHGLPQADREFSLTVETKKKKKLAGEASCKTCDQCYAVVASATATCPYCVFEFRVAQATPLEEHDGELVEVSEVDENARRDAFAQLQATGESRGYAPGWAAHQYKARFKHWPPRNWTARAPAKLNTTDTIAQRREYFENLRAECRAKGYRTGYVYAKYKARYGSEPLSDWMMT